MGDIVVKLFYQVGDISLLISSNVGACFDRQQECPKTVENFTVHCKNGYYVASPALLKCSSWISKVTKLDSAQKTCRVCASRIKQT